MEPDATQHHRWDVAHQEYPAHGQEPLHRNPVLLLLGVRGRVLVEDVPLPVIDGGHAILRDGLLDHLAVLLQGQGADAAPLID